MKLKMKTITLAVTAAVALGFGASASAQISGDVIKIGFITDMSGLYSDIDGAGGVEAIKMAIADMGGNINGKKIELITADHQNKADIAASKAREWFDQQKVDRHADRRHQFGDRTGHGQSGRGKEKAFICDRCRQRAPDQ